MDPIDIRFFKMAVGGDRIRQETPTDITARCPICGDSRISKSKARLHLYEKNGVTLVNCFNECSVQNLTMDKFLRNFYPSLHSSYKDEKGSNALLTLKSLVQGQREQSNFLGFVGLGDFDMDLYQRDSNSKVVVTVPTNEENKLVLTGIGANPPCLFDLTSNFKKDDNRIAQYCKSRGIDYNKDWNWLIGKNICIDGKNFPIKDYVIIPLYCGNSMYGFYSRSLYEHKFFTYIPSNNVGFKVWNLYNIDIEKPVYVFEGIFDALSAYQCGITNVIACLGATPPLDLLKGLDLVFCLDNDRTGYLNSIKYLKHGYKALIYPDSVKHKDTNDMLKAGIDIKDLILNNIGSGILAQVKIQRKL